MTVPLRPSALLRPPSARPSLRPPPPLRPAIRIVAHACSESSPHRQGLPFRFAGSGMGGPLCLAQRPTIGRGAERRDSCRGAGVPDSRWRGAAGRGSAAWQRRLARLLGATGPARNYPARSSGACHGWRMSAPARARTGLLSRHRRALDSSQTRLGFRRETGESRQEGFACRRAGILINRYLAGQWNWATDRQRDASGAVIDTGPLLIGLLMTPGVLWADAQVALHAHAVLAGGGSSGRAAAGNPIVGWPNVHTMQVKAVGAFTLSFLHFASPVHL
jgi:hypothetical protein